MIKFKYNTKKQAKSPISLLFSNNKLRKRVKLMDYLIDILTLLILLLIILKK